MYSNQWKADKFNRPSEAHDWLSNSKFHYSWAWIIITWLAIITPREQVLVLPSHTSPIFLHKLTHSLILLVNLLSISTQYRSSNTMSKPAREPINKLVLNWLKEYQKDSRANMLYPPVNSNGHQSLPSPPILDSSKSLSLVNECEKIKYFGI